MKILADLVQLHEPAAEGATGRAEELEDPLAKVKQAVWGVLHADDAGIVSPYRRKGWLG